MKKFMLLVTWYFIVMGILFTLMLIYISLDDDYEFSRYRPIVQDYHNEELGAIEPSELHQGLPGVVNGPYIRPGLYQECNQRQYPKRKQTKENSTI